MRDNADFRYLYDLRTQLLKEGVLGGISASAHIEHFDTRQLAELPRPPGASGFFIGDQLGGSGWIVKLEDGSEERFYVELPSHWRMKTWGNFVEVSRQLRLRPPETPIDRLLSEYVDYLSRLIVEAKRDFATWAP